MDDETDPTPMRSDRADESEPTETPTQRTAGEAEQTRGVGDDEPPPECAPSPDHASSPEDGAADGDEPLEYRLERLRLWRAVVTLAIVIGRLIRSF